MNSWNSFNSMILLLILPYVFLGCSDQNFKQFFYPTKELKELKHEIDILKAKIETIKKYNEFLASEIYPLKWKVDKYESCHLDPTSKSYQRLDTNTGTFLVSLQDVKPYAGGYKLVLHIGNPYIAQFKGFKLAIKWGKEINYIKYEDWQKSLRQREVSFTETLLPGTWNKVELAISPATKEETGYLELSMVTDLISLMGKK
jgi:hypothetical protein